MAAQLAQTPLLLLVTGARPLPATMAPRACLASAPDMAPGMDRRGWGLEPGLMAAPPSSRLAAGSQAPGGPSQGSGALPERSRRVSSILAPASVPAPVPGAAAASGLREPRTRWISQATTPSEGSSSSGAGAAAETAAACGGLGSSAARLAAAAAEERVACRWREHATGQRQAGWQRGQVHSKASR